MRFTRILGLVGSLLAFGFWGSRAEAIVTFRTKTPTITMSPPAATGPQAIALGDVDGDGWPDLIVVQPSIGTVSIFLNDGTGGFSTTPKVELGSSNDTQAVTTADFDGDGKLDLAVVNHNNPGTVTVYFGDGTGNFSAPQTIGVDPGPVALVAADLNGDSIPDLAVLSDASVYVIKSNGNARTFTPFNPSSIATNGTGGFSIAAKQINTAHNFTDLAVSNAGSQTVSVLFGNNDGTFVLTPARPISVQNAQDLVIGDFDADGVPDIAVISRTDADVSMHVQLLIGDGNGNFRSVATDTTEFGPVAITAADVDSDGKTDILVGSVGEGGGGIVQLFCQEPSDICNEPTGYQTIAGFQLQQRNVTSVSSTAVKAIDLNRDGHPDVVSVQNNGSSVAAVLNTTFQPTATPGTPGSPTAPPGVSFTPTPTVPTSTPTVTSTPIPTSTPTPIPTVPYSVCSSNDPGQPAIGGKPAAVAIGDFYHDGNPAIAVADNQGNRVVLVHSHINGAAPDACGVLGLTSGTVLANVAAPVALAAADFDLDGKLDLAVVGSAGLTVFFGDGKGGFTSPTPQTAGTAPAGLAIADFNRDGVPDIIVVNKSSNDVSIFFGKGQRAFDSPCTVPVGRSASLVVAQDLNGDRRPDFAVVSPQGMVAFLQPPTSTTPTTPTCPNGVTFLNLSPTRLSQPPQGVAVDVLDPTSTIPSLAVAESNSGGSLEVFKGSVSSGTLSYQVSNFLAVPAPSGSSQPSFASAIGTGDINRDGRPDLIVTDSTNNTVVAFLASADGTFSKPSIPEPLNGRGPVALALGDIDGDGIPEIVTANRDDGSISILVSSRPPATPTPMPTSTPTVTATPTATFTASPTFTPTATPTPTNTPQGTLTPTRTLSPTQTPTDTPKPGVPTLNGSCALDPASSQDQTWLGLSVLAAAVLTWRSRMRRGTK